MAQTCMDRKLMLIGALYEGLENISKWYTDSMIWQQTFCCYEIIYWPAFKCVERTIIEKEAWESKFCQYTFKYAKSCNFVLYFKNLVNIFLGGRRILKKKCLYLFLLCSRCLRFLSKESLNSDGQQLHQYQQYEQPTLTSNHWTQNDHDIWHWKSSSWLGENTNMWQD